MLLAMLAMSVRICDGALSTAHCNYSYNPEWSKLECAVDGAPSQHPAHPTPPHSPDLMLLTAWRMDRWQMDGLALTHSYHERKAYSIIASLVKFRSLFWEEIVWRTDVRTPDGQTLDRKILLLHTLTMRKIHIASLVKFCPMV